MAAEIFLHRFNGKLVAHQRPGPRTLELNRLVRSE